MSRRGAAWSVLLAGWQPLAVVLAHAVLAHAAQAELAQPNVKVRVLKRPSRGATRLIMRDVPPPSTGSGRSAAVRASATSDRVRVSC